MEQIAHAREIAASGQPLLKIQSGTDVEMELIVPSRWLTWLRPGATFGFAVDETGNSVRGQVTRFGASVDPVSKTIRVKAKMTQSEIMALMTTGFSTIATGVMAVYAGMEGMSAGHILTASVLGAPAGLLNDGQNALRAGPHAEFHANSREKHLVHHSDKAGLDPGAPYASQESFSDFARLLQ